MVNQIQAPTMKNATSLSSVYRGDNITGKEVKTAIIFSPCTIHVYKLKYYKPHNLTSEGCTVPLLGRVHNTDHYFIKSNNKIFQR